MPITNDSSYGPTMQQFVAHWGLVDGFLNPGTLKLAGNYTRANFTTDRTATLAGIDAVTDTERLLTQSRATVAAQRTALRARLAQFREQVRAKLPGSVYLAALPILPPPQAITTRFLRPMQRAAAIWQQINTDVIAGFTPPLLLAGSYSQANFVADNVALQTAEDAMTNAQGNVTNAMKQRDKLFANARSRMLQYRSAARATLPTGNALLKSIPRYSPLPGATPKPVTDLLFDYDVKENIVTMTFAPSVSMNIKKYQIFFSPGPKWDSGNMLLVATNENTPPYRFQFSLMQVEPDQMALFKVYVTNETENVRASRVLKIKRAVPIPLTVFTAPAVERAA